MENKKLKDYYSKGLAIFFVTAMCIAFFFILFRFEEFRKYIDLIVDILKPFIYGAVIAYLLTPICNWLERGMESAVELDKMTGKKAVRYKKAISATGIFLSLLFFCVVIYALCAMVVPQFISSMMTLIEAMPGYIQTLTIWIEKLAADNPILLQYVEEYSDLMTDTAQNFTKSYVIPNMNSIITGVSTSIRSVINLVMDCVIGLIVAVYLMSSRKTFARQSKMVVQAVFKEKEDEEPKEESRADWIIREVGILNSYLGGFVKGKLVDSLIIGLICMVFTAVTNMPYAVLISVIIGVTNIIPFFGPFIGAIPTALLILVVSPTQFLYFVIFVVVLQQFDGNILGPLILGDITNLNSFWVLFAILLFGGLFGIVGMVVGVPIFAFFYQLCREWVRKRLDLQDEVPTEAAEEIKE